MYIYFLDRVPGDLVERFVWEKMGQNPDIDIFGSNFQPLTAG